MSNPSSSSKVLNIALVLGAPALAMMAVVACSGAPETEPSSKSTANSTSGSAAGNGGSGQNTTSDKAGACPSPTIDLSFSPMYSAYIPGTTAHTFQIPATADSTSPLTWSASDPSKVDLTPDPTSGGIMITVKGSGEITIFATAKGGACGAAQLNVTSAAEADWEIGNARYNNGNSLKWGRHDGGAGDGGLAATDGGGPACTNCHGPTATNGPFKDVSHTPEQTGGFTDQDLVDLIVNGIVPDGGYFDPNVIIADASGDPTGATQAKAYQRWQSFHAWKDIDEDQKLGMVVYLRSLTPTPQEGSSNFGGRDGGHHHDSGK